MLLHTAFKSAITASSGVLADLSQGIQGRRPTSPEEPPPVHKTSRADGENAGYETFEQVAIILYISTTLIWGMSTTCITKIGKPASAPEYVPIND